MAQSNTLTRFDRSVLLRIVGSRKGADLDALLAFERAHHRQEPSADEIRASVARLIAAELIVQQGNQYFGTPQVQAAFLNECRNCSDTIEEFDVLNRIITQFGRLEEPEGEGPAAGPHSSPSSEPRTRWRG